METYEVHEVVAIQKPNLKIWEVLKIQDSLDQIVKCSEALETCQQLVPRTQRYCEQQQRRRQDQQNGETELRCWMCGELVHIRR